MNIPNDELIKLTDKSVIVTGGAMGIGFGIAYRMAEAGAQVFIVDKNEEAGARAVQELSDKGFKSLFIKADVSNENDINNAVNFALNICGRIDVLVNNAGIYPNIKLMDIKAEDFDKIISINLKSVVLFTQAVVKGMIANNGGKIINITSIDALHPSSVGLAIYDASKHGLWGFTKNSALELASNNIQVNAIAPGGITTPGTGMDNPKNPEMEEVVKNFSAKIPMKRMGVADDIGKVALFLASDMASYMTGSQIVVDGGFLLA